MKIYPRYFLFAVAVATASLGLHAAESPQRWYEEGAKAVEQRSAIAKQAASSASLPAKNIILFVGDGMGISTVTAARILDGQMKGMNGEENALFFETFPHLALSKTYNTNQQTPDSAGTMTAMMSGIKTKAGLIGVNQNVVRGDCDSQQNNEVTTALELAEIAGMSTGIISTARITHATPAATYAHIMDRNFESDSDASRLSKPGKCIDIARQLVEFPKRFTEEYPWVDGLEVAMGGGRRNFIANTGGADLEDGGFGARKDGKNLTLSWLKNHANSKYVWNKKQFDAIDPQTTDHLLGLFDMSHMEYEYDRATDTSGEPSLSEMTEKAILMLEKNQSGFFLQIESGRIDHAHHSTNAKRALLETIELANAVQTAYENTDPKETLIIVTADHSHVFTMAGYPTRGNPILGKVVNNDSTGTPNTSVALAEDGLPYTTLGYTNGPSFDKRSDTHGDASHRHTDSSNRRTDLTETDTTDGDYHHQTLVPTYAETHGGEDVAIYAIGPGASLVSGVMEQNVIYHVMNRAGNLEKRAAKRANFSGANFLKNLFTPESDR